MPTKKLCKQTAAEMRATAILNLLDRYYLPATGIRTEIPFDFAELAKLVDAMRVLGKSPRWHKGIDEFLHDIFVAWIGFCSDNLTEAPLGFLPRYRFTERTAHEYDVAFHYALHQGIFRISNI